MRQSWIYWFLWGGRTWPPEISSRLLEKKGKTGSCGKFEGWFIGRFFKSEPWLELRIIIRQSIVCDKSEVKVLGLRAILGHKLFPSKKWWILLVNSCNEQSIHLTDKRLLEKESSANVAMLYASCLYNDSCHRSKYMADALGADGLSYLPSSSPLYS